MDNQTYKEEQNLGAGVDEAVYGLNLSGRTIKGLFCQYA